MVNKVNVSNVLLAYLEQLIPCDTVSEVEVDNGICSYILHVSIDILMSL